MWYLLPLLCAQIRGLQITSLVVPQYVVNNSGLAVLDCQYTLDPKDLQGDSGLVVKWFFNNGPAPVYQWIPSQRPQDLGILRGRLNLDHRASDNNATMYRALSIVNPTTELSGEYRCAVSTFTDEDFMIEKMIVYAPEKQMEMVQAKPDPEHVNVTCRAWGLYPEPRIALYRDPYTPKISKPLQGVTVETSSKTGHYDILASAVFADLDLHVPTTFICEVCIPTTEYCRRKRLVYYPGSMASYISGSSGLNILKSTMSWAIALTLALLAAL
ncbi:uncharacterized protein LOC128983036 [Macrosteles quadrilineatus]|uniref:uncharacterized protein LOC128983036 n=1 Tax=Macrosteles quadrilineatus TaxID=74068 RepID=UPI0023E23118|nr:uncharacterized protein LOC128983036 [Macrosteles quadrilineatus]XP_054258139.1 uncharacterized protein LOC128983036 [Macrosteles quadrilineatus]